MMRKLLSIGLLLNGMALFGAASSGSRSEPTQKSIEDSLALILEKSDIARTGISKATVDTLKTARMLNEEADGLSMAIDFIGQAQQDIDQVTAEMQDKGRSRTDRIMIDHPTAGKIERILSGLLAAMLAGHNLRDSDYTGSNKEKFSAVAPSSSWDPVVYPRGEDLVRSPEEIAKEEADKRELAYRRMQLLRRSLRNN